MIRELINFTASLDDEFKNQGSLPKEGLHIMLSTRLDKEHLSLDTDNYRYERFSKKQPSQSEFLEHCKLLHQHAWCIDTNKCFDLPTKAIHSCSPFLVAFKREHLEGGGKFNENIGKKNQIYDRFGTYFNKAFELLPQKEAAAKYDVFRNFFTDNQFSDVLKRIVDKHAEQYSDLQESLTIKQNELRSSKDKGEKEIIKGQVAEIEQLMLQCKPLDDSEYVIFYLDLPLSAYQEAQKKYLDDKLFNTAAYNTSPDDEGIIYGTSNFMNGFNASMPFLIHQTASFDISGRISNEDAKYLNDFINILPNKSLPNPLPIFIYKGELLEGKVIGIFKESGFKAGYKEIITRLIEEYKDDISNYYLLFWQNTKDGIVFKDFDFVTKFEYEIDPILTIQNLFEIKERGEKNNKRYPLIENVFDFEQYVFKILLQSKYQKLDYFGELDKDAYMGLDLTFHSFSKYRKSVYDYIFKSQRSAVSKHTFDEMVFSGIIDDIKNGNGERVKEKLNIWYSISDFFGPIKEIKMVNKLKTYQDFVSSVIAGEELTDITDEKFAFSAGQVIDYILDKSKSADTSFNLLEPYLQQSKCTELKKAISNDFNRYKHENFSRNFKQVAAFVLSYETDANMKNLMPQLLSGVFAKNQLYSSIIK